MEQEDVVSQQLSQLIRDAVWLKSYLASVMRLSQEAFSMSQAALGPQQAAPPPVRPLPAHVLWAGPAPVPAGLVRVECLAAVPVCTPPVHCTGSGRGVLQEQAITQFPSTPEHAPSGLIGAGRPLTPVSQVTCAPPLPASSFHQPCSAHAQCCTGTRAASRPLPHPHSRCARPQPAPLRPQGAQSRRLRRPAR